MRVKTVANKIDKAVKNNFFASMLMQLHSQSAQQEQMQRELQDIRTKLAQASKTLAQKDLLIDSLELDLEHMIDQLVKIQHNQSASRESKQWMARPVPGLTQEISSSISA